MPCADPIIQKIISISPPTQHQCRREQWTPPNHPRSVSTFYCALPEGLISMSNDLEKRTYISPGMGLIWNSFSKSLDISFTRRKIKSKRSKSKALETHIFEFRSAPVLRPKDGAAAVTAHASHALREVGTDHESECSRSLFAVFGTECSFSCKSEDREWKSLILLLWALKTI